VLKLYTLGGAFGLRNVSPFCLKVEMAMTHLGLDYALDVEVDPRKAPKGKLPFLVLEDGTKLADSELILQYLDELTQGRLFGDLSAQELAQGYAFSRLAEDHFYWIGVASRWLDDKWFPNIVEGFFHFVPGLIRGFAARGAQKQVKQTYELHGLGRHSHEEQVSFARRDLQAISDVVQEDRYIVGHRLTVFDFTMAAMLSGFIDNQPATWITELANEYPALRDYMNRIQDEVGVYAK